MQIEYNPTKKRGEQWTVIMGATRLTHLSQSDAMGLLHREGIGYTDARSRVSAAKVAGLCDASTQNTSK